MRSRRLELPQGFPHKHLKLARLPFRHDRIVPGAVTIVEGWSFRELRRALEAAPQLGNTLAGQGDAADIDLDQADDLALDRGATDRRHVRFPSVRRARSR